MIAQPLLCLIGTLLNLICLVALSVPFFQHGHGYCRKTSLLIYLVALSACNSIQFILSFFVVILPAAEQFIDEEMYPETYKSLREFNGNAMFLVYPPLIASNYCSLWILTLICIQRYQSICNPQSVWKSRLYVFRKSKCWVALAVATAVGKFQIKQFSSLDS